MVTPPRGGLALLWHRFGPYHRARLRAVRRLAPCVGVEFSPVDPVYAWSRLKADPGMRVLFGDRHSQDVPPAELRARLDRVLAELAPSALAIPGWSDRAPLAALEWAKDHGVPAVLMSPSQRADAPRAWAREWVKGRLVRCFDAALVGGGPQARYLEELGFPPGRVVRGYNAVDNAHFRRGARLARRNAPALRRSLGLPKDYFLASARMVPKKNLENLLRAYRVYLEGEGKRAWGLVLLGDGPLRGRLEALRSELGLGRSVVLPGFRQYGELPAYYGLGRAFVLPSLSEQWGLAVNEAMAAGLPALVSARCGCAEDLVREGATGWLLDPLDVDGMARALARASRTPAEGLEAMGAAAQRAVEACSPAAFARGLGRAVELARAAPRRPLGALDRALLGRVMARTFQEPQDA